MIDYDLQGKVMSAHNQQELCEKASPLAVVRWPDRHPTEWHSTMGMQLWQVIVYEAAVMRMLGGELLGEFDISGTT